MQITSIIAIFFMMLAGDILDQEWLVGIPSRGVFLSFAGLLLLEWSLCRWLVGLILQRIERYGWFDRSTAHLPGRIDLLTRIMVVSAYAAFVLYGGWGKLIVHELHLQSHRVVLLGELALIIPFIVFEMLRLWCYYPVNRVVREQIMMSQLADGVAARPVWTRRQYLAFQLRQNILLVLVPILIIITFKDIVELLRQEVLVPMWGDRAGDWLYYATEAATSLGALSFFILAPLVLRHIWLTSSLPEGTLRVQLGAFCRRLNLRYRDLLLWRTYNSVGNAAVMGLWGRFRFILLTDALVENLPDREIFAVFGHEAGHARAHHIFFFMLFIVGYTLSAGVALEVIFYAFDSIGALQGLWQQLPWVVNMVLGLGIGGVWVFLFGWISRHFERQADLLGALSLDISEDSDMASAHRQLQSTFSKGPLSPEAAHTMATALNRIAMVNGVPIVQRSFRHSSIQARIHFLYLASQDSSVIVRFARLIHRIKAGIIVGLILGLIGWYALM